MRSSKLFILLGIITFVASCNQEEESALQPEPIKTELKYAQQAPSSSNVNATPFTLKNVGIYNNYLYANTSYVGGDKRHEFSINWDGVIKETEDNKIIQLNIFHLTDDDHGNMQIQDSLYLSLDELNIPDEVKTDKTLIYDIVNSSDITNHFLVEANPEPTPIDVDQTSYIHYYNYELEVKKAECNEVGALGNYWLKSLSKDSTIYMIPASIDEAVTYSPKENDVIKVKCLYTSLSDITGASECDFIIKNESVAIDIMEIEKIN